MLKLGKYTFEENLDDSCLTVYIGDRKNGSEWNIDCLFKADEYEGETVSPEIIINNVHTKKYDIRGLAGEKFETRKINESEEREDSLYLFEHEPFQKMKVKIMAIEENRAHIVCRGTAVEDGYAVPVRTVEFEWDCWLPLTVKYSDPFGHDFKPDEKSPNASVVTINGFGHAETEDLARYEEESGFIFPEDYRNFLLQYNGGFPEAAKHHIDTDLFQPRQKIRYFYGITRVDVFDETALKPQYNLFSMYAKYHNSFDMQHSILIASVYGQYSFCLFTGEKMQGVYYFDSSKGEDREFHKFCDTFTDFMNLIVTDEI